MDPTHHPKRRTAQLGFGRLALTILLILIPMNNAVASEEPRDKSQWVLPLTVSLAVVSVPMGVNTYSTITGSPVSTLWHWSGYGIGGLTFAMGTVGLVSNLEQTESKNKILASGVMAYGLCHLAAAYYASKIKPAENAGVLTPMMLGENQFGLSWIKPF